MQTDSKQMPQQPHKDEIIYEFKYSFPKGKFNRFERIVDRIATIIVFYFSLLILTRLYNYSAIYDTMILIFSYPTYLSLENWLVLGLYSICFPAPFLLVLWSFNGLFFRQRNAIWLTNEGMYIRSSGFLKLWYQHRFYKYGEFGFYVNWVSSAIYTGSWVIRINDINTQYRHYFHNLSNKESKVYVIVDNDEQDMKKLLEILREKTQEALEKQSKANQYDLREKIKPIKKRRGLQEEEQK